MIVSLAAGESEFLRIPLRLTWNQANGHRQLTRLWTVPSEQSHEHIGKPGTADVTCTITNNIVHHIGYSGIAILDVKGKRCMPLVKGNVTYRNMGGGIGSREGAQPVIADNFSHDNSMAGIGVRTPGTMAIVVNNRCLENRLVAIGLPDGATAFLHGITLKRTGGGAPPLVAVKGDSTAVFSNNSVTGGGVAGLLVQGRVLAVGNTFHGKGPGQGSAIWVWKGSTLAVAHNRFDGYRNAVNASESKVTAADNLVSRFEKAAIIVRKPSAPYHVSNTRALADNPQFTAASLDGRKPAADDGNVVKPTSAAKDLPTTLGRFWSTASDTSTPIAAVPRTESVEDGRWKLVAATKSGKTTYILYDLKSDPQGTIDRSEHLEQIVFLLRGLLEKRSGKAYQAALRGERPGR